MTLARRISRILVASGLGFALLLPAAAVAAGPPFPDPVTNQAVYDTAGVLRPGTVARVETTIDGIEARTGAEVVVYTQLVPDGITTEQAETQARALMDQWGVGRAGIDDGLVILFDLHQDDPCHGQVQLYAGPGYASTYLSNSERQTIFDNDMLPLLRQCDPDGALLVAMDKIDANATSGHATLLGFFRILDALLGLVVAPLVLVLILGGSLLRWYRTGRDPVYLDDPSIHIPAPPPGLTPAAGAAIRDGKVTRRALTTASLDLAARGLITFQTVKEPSFFRKTPEIGIVTTPATPTDPVEAGRMTRARSRPMDDATRYLQQKLGAIGAGDGYIKPDDLIQLGSDVKGFDSRLETHLVAQGWYREAPAKVTARFGGLGVAALVLGIAAFVVGVNLPSGGLVLVAVALIVSAVGVFAIATAMPARTQDGAVIRAMLEAYRRTLEKTMALASSMDEVVRTSAIPLIEEPDDAVVWGVALGLHDEVEAVLQRSAEELQSGHAGAYWLPAWYAGSSGSGSAGGGGGWAPGLMSSSAIPNFGGMMAALGTIGNSPSSSGGGGGGFSGGGSGGGGGGSGGGF